MVIYVLADGGSVAGGWLSSFFIKRGWPVNRARKTTLFICAMCILPVMFVTRISTQFDVDGRFFDRLQKATYATERIETVNGRTQVKRAREQVPPVVQSRLHELTGRSFSSAKEFVQAAGGALGTAYTNEVEAALPPASGPYEVNPEFVERIKQSVSPGAGDSLRSLRGQPFSSRQEFVAAVSGAVGKAQANRMDHALLSSSRTNNSIYWIAVLLIALGAAGHQAWSANIFTLVSDVFPKKATASVTGIGGMVGAVAGMLGDLYLGKVLSSSGPSGYFFAFLIAGSCYLVLLGVVHLLMPRMTPLDENLQPVQGERR